MNINTARNTVGGIWIMLFLILFGIFTYQTISGFYGGEAKKAWDWLTPHILPIVGVILGAVAAGWSTTDQSEETPQIKLTVFWLAIILSLVHFLVITATVVFAAQTDTISDNLATLESANIPLAITQGLVTTILVVFFKDIVVKKLPAAKPG